MQRRKSIFGLVSSEGTWMCVAGGDMFRMGNGRTEDTAVESEWVQDSLWSWAGYPPSASVLSPLTQG